VRWDDYNRFRLQRPVVWSALAALVLGAWCVVLTGNLILSVGVEAVAFLVFSFSYGPGGPLRERIERKSAEHESRKP
jgi:hypothetical protein